MSGIRAVDLGLVLPGQDPGDDPPARPRALSYDFSRWNAPDAGEALDAAGEVDVTFKVYTPDAIKAQPIRRAPPPQPNPEEGIRDLGEALQVAKSIGPRELLTRFGVGAAAGLLMLFALAGFATLADDTSDGRGILAASTETPSAAGLMPSLAAMPTVVSPAEPIAASPSDETYFELPDPGAQKPKRAARTATGKSAKALVRENPY